ncbi:MAG: hypothetical protein JSW67_01900, partial [Candidatus Latescibacterota bacterium]
MLRMIGSALALVALLGLAACNSITGVTEDTDQQDRGRRAEGGEFTEPEYDGVSKMELEGGLETAIPSRAVSVFHAQRKMELEGG